MPDPQKQPLRRTVLPAPPIPPGSVPPYAFAPPAPPPTAPPTDALQHAETITATPNDQLLAQINADLAGEYATPQPTVMRAPTWREWIGDRARDLYESVAAQPLARISDAFGLSDFAGKAAEYGDARLAAEPRMGIPPPIGPLGEIAQQADRGLYSRVDEALAKVPKKGAHPNKIASLIKQGASQEESSYRKLPEFLAGKGNATVTPEEIQAHLAANPPPMPERVTRGKAADLYNEFVGKMEQKYGVGYDTAQLTRDERAMQQRLWNDQGMRTEKAPKYQSYTLPGGENYRESLFTLPQRQGQELGDVQTRLVDLNHALDLNRGEMPRHELDRMIAERNALYDRMAVLERDLPQPYYSGHWDEPNILVHTRETERALPDVGPGRFLEEVQSDWHQAGKSRGYAQPPSPETEAQLTRLRDEIDKARSMVADINYEQRQASNAYEDRLRMEVNRALPPEWQHLHSFGDATRTSREAVDAWRAARDPVMSTPEMIQLRDAEQLAGVRLQRAVDRVTELERQHTALQPPRDTVPDAPFKETWPDLALKQHVLDVARDPNLSWIGHASGQTQAERYDLAKQISKLEYNPDEGRLYAYDREGDRVIRENVDPDAASLAEYIGREPAEKLAQQIEQHKRAAEWERDQWSPVFDAETGKHMISDPNGEIWHNELGMPYLYDTPADAHEIIDDILLRQRSSPGGAELPSLSGLDLSVGGEGMKSFYDQLLPARLQKILKPFGATVERGSMPVTKSVMEDVPGFTVIDNWGNSRGSFYTMEEADAYRRNPGEGMTSYVNANSAIRPIDSVRSVERQVDEPIWFARLTPEQKQRIRQAGLPLLTLPFVIDALRRDLDQVATPPPPPR